MDDEFLYKARPALSEGFANELRARLAAQGTGSVWKKAIDWPKARVVLGVVLAIGIVAACAREVLRPHYVQVGDMSVLEVGPVEAARLQFRESVDSGSLPPEPVPVVAALESVPYPLALASELPEGFSLRTLEISPPNYPMWLLFLAWEDEKGQRIWFESWAGTGAYVKAPRGAWREVEIAGIPAVLLRGSFPEPPDPLMMPTPNEYGYVELRREWNDKGGIQLIWNAGGGHFELRTFGPYVSEKVLIRMAESMIE